MEEEGEKPAFYGHGKVGRPRPANKRTFHPYPHIYFFRGKREEGDPVGRPPPFLKRPLFLSSFPPFLAGIVPDMSREEEEKEAEEEGRHALAVRPLTNPPVWEEGERSQVIPTLSFSFLLPPPRSLCCRGRTGLFAELIASYIQNGKGCSSGVCLKRVHTTPLRKGERRGRRVALISPLPLPLSCTLFFKKASLFGFSFAFAMGRVANLLLSHGGDHRHLSVC